jgi:beta-glucanase (GH16 family)
MKTTLLLRFVTLLGTVALLGALFPLSSQAAPTGPTPALGFHLVWQDEFNGPAGSPPSAANWLYDTGTGYGCAGCPSNWGTGEVETMTNSTANVYLDGSGHLAIKPIRDANGNWTSGRIETQQTDFAAPPHGTLAVQASIQLPDVTGAAAEGYWPAFWMLGSAFRGNYLNWPGVGEVDIMENVNGLNQEFGTLHCGTAPGGPCNEYSGLGGSTPCTPTTCQEAFHTYRVEIDRGSSPEQIRWYLDGRQFFQVSSDQMDATTWANAVHHAFFVILDVAMGGAFPDNVPQPYHYTPTPDTASGVPMLVDYVRVYTRQHDPGP